MFNVKIDKHGRITIPANNRKNLGLTEGHRMSISNIGGHIEVNPYKYKCRYCEVDIPDGDEYGNCDRCRRKNVTKIY